ncbi:MAG TPA: zinc ribbon domain-containing protein [Methanofastidiosum sp.]|nr:zinc ribbon domain-containing protein [Methanofastidiosum sp.]HNZ87266.1 zinc ribbon domain-containing protein [Methanofastidiosum sp.]HOC77568.1 zinc ribbon domain-containing protein [Methanofastidiosum sp.]HOG74377.1 zinc ribbon domain-containing protein [Methanofastidiosum sp.]HPA49046.1 zinc ribbon domain-containing protein [Methanofastidiosum sp.]
MEDTFNLEVKIPEFIQLLGEEGRNQILDEIRKRVDKDVSNIVIKVAREIMSEKLGLDTRDSPFGPVHSKSSSPSVEEESDTGDKCPNCRKPIEPGVKFCRFCGQKIA